MPTLNTSSTLPLPFCSLKHKQYIQQPKTSALTPAFSWGKGKPNIMTQTQWHHLQCLTEEALYILYLQCVFHCLKQKSWQTLPVCCTSSRCRMWLSVNWFKWKPCVTYIATHQFLSTIQRSCYRAEYFTTHALHCHLIRKLLCLFSEVGPAITVWCSSRLLWDTMGKCRISPSGKFPFICCLYILWLNCQLK